MAAKSLYEELGIDPRKSSVREIFSKLIDNKYPGAFVNIIDDPFNVDVVMTQHQDGDGSKFIQRMLMYLENGDESIFAGMADDALSMNTGDIAACGFVFGPWIITNVLNLNLPKEIKEIVMKSVAVRLLELREIYQKHGFNIKFLGGETADLPDQVRSGVFDIAITAWADKSELIRGDVDGADVIYGFASDGQAVWEDIPNSGIMSNGLTMARSYLMDKSYNEKYPKLKRDGDFYHGRFLPSDKVELLGDMTIGEAIASPTRQWAIVIRELISYLQCCNALYMLHGISMNTGGGATKITNVGNGGIVYVKKMPEPAPIFQLIQQESGESWKNMYQSFNCGIGIDVVGEDHVVFHQAIKHVAMVCGISSYKLGDCEYYDDLAVNKVKLETPFGNFEY